MTRRMTSLLLLIGLMVVLGAAPAVAGRGDKGNKPTIESSITLDTTDALAKTSTALAGPTLGSEVTFSVTHPKSVKNPRVAVRCYQDGDMVYAQAGPYDFAFLLGGAASDWLDSGGSADCTAELFYFDSKGNKVTVAYSLATTEFAAAG